MAVTRFTPDGVQTWHQDWMAAQERSEHAALLAEFSPAEGASPPEDNVTLMRRVWGPFERGESDDFGPFFDLLADDVMFKLPVGELRGKAALIDYFANASTALEFNPFEKPLEYYGDGDRVVILGDETFRVKESGAAHRAEWAWVIDVHDGRITRIAAIQDLSGIADTIRAAVAKSRPSGEPPPTVRIHQPPHTIDVLVARDAAGNVLEVLEGDRRIPPVRG
jgi:uncharacterized protein